ncbi:MAG: OsmC family protein [Bacteroidetes bacterium]|nr:OsmC family protein [Bacteroidota bacterium]
MHHEATCEWKGGFEFDGTIEGFHITLDGAHKDGSPMKGPTPKPLLLLATAGCTGMDVVLMLEKMQVKPDSFSIDVKADGGDEHPKVYTDMKIIYRFTGEGLEASRDKIERAVSLSQEKYCGVSTMLRKAMEVSTEILIN